MKNRTFYSFLLVFLSAYTIAQPTFTEDIAPIVYNQCSVCHRSGEIGPMSLTNYEEVKNWSSTIKYVTGMKFMPPWKADPNYTRLQGENFLTDDQIQMIAEWVDAGSPEGPKSMEPAFPEFPDGSQLGEPDLVLTFKEKHFHKGNNRDEYRYFVLPTGLTEDKQLKAIELRPGNTKIVHHALFFEDTTGEALKNDLETPEYGFDGFGGFQGDNPLGILDTKQYPGYVPGQKPIFYPETLGQVLSANSDLVVQMHYAPWSTDETDSTTVNLFFADEEEIIEREVEAMIIIPTSNLIPGLADLLPGITIDQEFLINAGERKTFHATWEVPEDLSFMGITPHMHLLGQDWTVYLERPDGEIENLISIPEWDFNWQGAYYFNKFLVAPKGSIVHAFATYDNTAENPSNPSDPPRFVSWGEKTTDEMLYLPIHYVKYNEGDENIVFNEATTPVIDADGLRDGNYISSIAPNPVDGLVNIQFHLDQGIPLTIEIVDIRGKTTKVIAENQFFASGENYSHFQSNDLLSGMYFVRISSQNFEMTQKFVRQN